MRRLYACGYVRDLAFAYERDQWVQTSAAMCVRITVTRQGPSGGGSWNLRLQTPGSTHMTGQWFEWTAEQPPERAGTGLRIN